MSSSYRSSLRVLAAILLVSGVLLAAPTFAQQVDITSFAEQAGFSTNADIRLIIARLIRTFLGLTGIILVGLILYAGFLWMTAAGAEDKISTAKKILINAVIGLVLTFGAFAITQFVVGAITDAVGGGVGGANQNGGGGNGGFGDPPSARAGFSFVGSNALSCASALKNTSLQMTFSQPVQPSSVTASGGIVVKTRTGESVPGTFFVRQNLVTFTPSEVCSENRDERCFAPNTEYVVDLDPTTLRSTRGGALVCGIGQACGFRFTSGTAVDTVAPGANFETPSEGQSVILNDIVRLQARATDDVGVSSVEFRVNGQAVFSAGLTQSLNEELTTDNAFFTDDSEWNTQGLHSGRSQRLTAVAIDCAGHETSSTPVDVFVRAPSCANGVQDADMGETGVDCGGSPTEESYCGACAGSSCVVQADCQSGSCEEGQCVSGVRISDIVPNDGAIGNLITIYGSGFGSSPGTIVFGESGNEVRTSAYVCGTAPSWSDTQIVVQVPEGAVDGSIAVELPGGGAFDRSNDANGRRIRLFDVNTTTRPGICTLTPTSAAPGESVAWSGVQLGTSRSTSSAYIGTSLVREYTAWSASGFSGVVPNITGGNYMAQVFVGDNRCERSPTVACSRDADCGLDGGACILHREGSNTLRMTVTGREVASNVPVIQSVDSGWKACTNGTACTSDASCAGIGDGVCHEEPTWGPSGQFLTLRGTDFGTTLGQVRFTSSDGREAIGSLSLPAACEATAWGNTQVTVIVPTTYTNGQPVTGGEHTVTLVRGTDLATSVGVSFSVLANQTPGPSICAIDPVSGPVGSRIRLVGQQLGNERGTGYVEFFENTRAEALTWNSSSIQGILVPSGAASGPVSVVRLDGATSNGLDFTIRDCRASGATCTEGTSCCADGSCRVSCDTAAPSSHYAYRFSTAAIPVAPRLLVECRSQDGQTVSPTPSLRWSAEGSVCVNAKVAARFTEALDPASISSASVQVKRCTGSAEAPCETGETQTGQLTLTENGFDFVPTGGVWQSSARYQVTVTRDVRSLLGTPIEQAYTWEFSTKGSDEACSIGSVFVDPATFTAKDYQQEISYIAEVQALEDRCVLLNTEAYDFAWQSDFVGAELLEPNTQSAETTIRAIAETLSGVPAHILATIQIAPFDQGVAELTIDYVDPKVVSTWPNCDTACRNATIGVRFNTAMNAADLATTGLITVEKCANALCVRTEPVPVSPNQITIIPRDIGAGVQGDEVHLSLSPETLIPNTYYKVRLSGDIRSQSGVTLATSGTNDGDSYSWKFRTRSDAGVCGVERVEVKPNDVNLTHVGERKALYAVPFGTADACTAGGQALSWTAYTWETWVSANEDIAFLLGNPPGALPVATSLPLFCTNQCLRAGVSVGFDDALCGNGRKELGEDCDDGNTTSGDGCSTQCLYEAVNRCGEGETANCCGNGVLDAGEACDDGNAAGRDGCSASCENEGSQAVGRGALCGNGIVDFEPELGGESCDDGNTTSGDGCSSSCLNEGSIPVTQVTAVCGNGIVEALAGEECDDGALCTDGRSCTSNADCRGIGDGRCAPRDGGSCSRVCLNEGTPQCRSVCSTPAGRTCQVDGDCRGTVNGAPVAGTCDLVSVGACCGNGTLEAGEDCDDGNGVAGDGCSLTCLNEGSSISHVVPSFCGDGVLEASTTLGGEECEATAGATRIGPLAVAEISSEAPRFVDAATHLASTTVSARVENVTGSASLSLRCSCESDAQCGSGFSCGTGSCCFVRPTVEVTPAFGEALCRNTALSVLVSQPVDEAALRTRDQDGDGQITGAENIPPVALVLKELAGVPVASDACPAGHTFVASAQTGASWYVRALAWVKLQVRRLVGSEALAQVQNLSPVCLVPVSYTVTDVPSVNGPGSRISVLPREALLPNGTYELLVQGTSQGLITKNGVSPEESSSGVFTTGADICSLDIVQLVDLGSADRSLSSVAQVFHRGDEVHTIRAEAYARRSGALLEPLNELPGVYDWTWDWDTTILPDTSTTDVVAADEGDAAITSLRSLGQNGEESVIVTANVQKDGQDIDYHPTGSLPITAFLCEQPWPAFADGFPWIDDGSRFAPDVEAASPASQFSFYYCRDAGKEGIVEDLPAVNPVLSPRSPISNVIREILYVVEVGTCSNNPAQACQQDSECGEAASCLNRRGDALGVRVAQNPTYLSPLEWYRSQGFSGSPTSLTVDGYPAVRDGNTVYIAAPNLVQASESEGAKAYSNIYILSSNSDAGTFASSIFEQALANWKFNANTGTHKQCAGDPLQACETDVACGLKGPCVKRSGALLTDEGVCRVRNEENSLVRDQDGSLITCVWDADCPALQGETSYCSADKSKLRRDTKRLTDIAYLERLISARGSVPTLNEGTFVRTYSVSTWPSWSAALGNQLGTALPQDPLNQFTSCAPGADPASCYNASTNVFSCDAGSQVYGMRSSSAGLYSLYAQLEYTGAAWASPIDTLSSDRGSIFVATSYEGNLAAGFTGSNVLCSGAVYGSSSVCGDGIKGEGEECEIGEIQKDLNVCDKAFQLRSCVDVNGVCSFEPQNPAECIGYSCGNGVVEPGERCDEGANNGRYGSRCTTSCRIGSGPQDGVYFCGDGTIAGGEACDLGAQNGVYNLNPLASCSLDCRLPGPSCGDRQIQTSNGETCEAGDTETWAGKLCGSGPNTGQACTSDADCSGGVCGSTRGALNRVTNPQYEVCPTSRICEAGDADKIGKPCVADGYCSPLTPTQGVCSSATYPLTRLRSCITGQCTYGAWGACQSASSCGNGQVDGSEQCDDGNTNNFDACTNSCKRNVCGDGYLYPGVESCDAGAQNGVECSSEYGQTCNFCTPTCQLQSVSGAFCGNGVIEGSEFCDGAAVRKYCFAPQTRTRGADCTDLSATEAAVVCDPNQDDTVVLSSCQTVGVCNGGQENGSLCSADAQCPGGGVCVTPECAADCTGACPTGFRTVTLQGYVEPGTGAPATSFSLESFNAARPEVVDSARLIIPACRVGTALVADIDKSQVIPPSVDVVFVTDRSGSMLLLPNGNTATPQQTNERRINIVKDSLLEQINALFDAYTGRQSRIRIGLVSYKAYTAEKAFGGALYNDSPDHRVQLTSEVSAYPTNISTTDGTPSLRGIEAAVEMLENSTAEYKVIIHLTDGQPSNDQEPVHDPSRGCTSVTDCVDKIRQQVRSHETISFYSAALSTNPTSTVVGYTRHMSSDACGFSWRSVSDCLPKEGIEYSFSGGNASEIRGMYDQIVQSILGASVSFIYNNAAATGVVPEGRSVRLPLPSGFACTSEPQSIPTNFAFQGTGTIGVSNVRFTYCPAP